MARGLRACDVLGFLTHDQNQLRFVVRVVRAGGQHDILACADNAGTRFPEQTGKLRGRNRVVVHLGHRFDMCLVIASDGGDVNRCAGSEEFHVFETESLAGRFSARKDIAAKFMDRFAV